MPVVLLLVRAGPRGELLLGEPRVRAHRVPRGLDREEACAHLLAAKDRRPLKHQSSITILVSLPDQRGGDPGGSIGVPHSAGDALERGGSGGGGARGEG